MSEYINREAAIKAIKGLESATSFDFNEGLISAMNVVYEIQSEDVQPVVHGQRYNNHEVACIITEIVGDACACNVNGIDEWLPEYCEFRETCCPAPVGVACWEQYLTYKDRARHES